MLTVLFNWGYIFVTAFLIGFAVLLPFERGCAAAGRAPGGRDGYCPPEDDGGPDGGACGGNGIFPGVQPFCGSGALGKCAVGGGVCGHCGGLSPAFGCLLAGKGRSMQQGVCGVFGGTGPADGLWDLQRVYACGYRAVSCPGHTVDRGVWRGSGAG